MSAVPVWRLSGGAANAAPAASLGGAMSSVAAAATLYDDISGADSSAGMTDYRGVYITNTGDVDLVSAVAWVVDESDSSADIQLAVAAEGVGVTMATIANELAVPATVSFVQAATKGAGIALGTIPAGSRRGVWIKRVVAPATPANAVAGFTLRCEGDTT